MQTAGSIRSIVAFEEAIGIDSITRQPVQGPGVPFDPNAQSVVPFMPQEESESWGWTPAPNYRFRPRSVKDA